jgi:leucyl-tRNA synthetase
MLFQKRVLTVGETAFSRSLPFSELDTLQLLKPLIEVSMKYRDLQIVSAEEALEHIAKNGESDTWSKERAESAEPGSPALQFWNVE